jgi:gliding motility-associated-like protein
MFNKKLFPFLLLVCLSSIISKAFSQCGGILEPGFKFLTSSRGCAPYTVNLETLYLNTAIGTKYFIDWGDGTPEQSFTQTNATGVTVSHVYPVASVDCGYDLVIDASNACNPRGSVVPIRTEVIVWTKDVVKINPAEIRVCQGFATNLSFTDGSTWNCFPRATRENKEPRWVQWIYGTGPLVNQIPGMQVNSILPGAFPYLNPAPVKNPMYPVLAPGQISLPMNVPATAVADIGKEFVVTLKNWNQCNPYDNNLLDGNGLNPVGGDLVNGDNAAQVTTARIVIVASPQPTFVTRLGNSSGPIKTIFCIDDAIFFDDNTPAIGGASFRYTWQFFDNATGVGVPLSTSNSSNPTFSYPTGGQKLIRLTVKDNNAQGTCANTVDNVITISPSLIAKIGISDLANNPISPLFCQEAASPFTTFQARFKDISVGTVTATTEWRWEFYNESNVLVRQEPSVGFSALPLDPFDQPYLTKGIYRVKLRIRDNATTCESVDEVKVIVYEKPVALFTAPRTCEGKVVSFSEASTLQAVNGEKIVLREWDFNYNGTVFNKDPAFDNLSTFTRLMGPSATYQVALRVTTDQHACSSLLVVPVRIDPLPNASFTPNVSSGCGPLTVNFTNNSVSGQPDAIDRFVWEVDARGGLGFQPIATQRPTDPGFSSLFTTKFQNFTTTNKIYDIRLRVITVNTCEQLTTAQVITVFPGPISGFSELNYSPFNSNCSPVSVNFKADNQTQSLNPTDYTWKVSDVNGVVSQTSTGTNPAFNFNFSNLTNSFKDFSVNLITTLAAGCKGDSARTIRISPVPISLFVIDTLLFDCQQVKVRLTAIQKGLSTYHWIVTENAVTVLNTTSTQDQIERIFIRPAPSSTNLAVQFSLDTKNFANCLSPITNAPIIIPKQENINASFNVTPATQTLPNSTVTINNTTNTGSWTYLWDFGDKNTSTDPNITSHSYETYGVYTLTLTVTSKYCIEKSTQTITILAIPPVVDFSYNPPAGCVPLRVEFTNLSKYADQSTYQWDFGDGATSKDVNPAHVYGRADTYTVTLSASNVTGERITKTKQRIIQAYPRPTASFDVKPRLLYIPGGILYTNNLSFDANTFSWDFGDNTFSADPEPEHRYVAEGDYTIRLKASNQFGCADSAKLVNVVKVLKGGQVLVPNAFSPNLSGGAGSSGSGGSISDGKNDMFLPVMRGVTIFELLIFDRWGELLFESRDATRGWDGSYNGKLCQQDVYMYKLTASFETGETVVRVGDVNLIR